jgi:hypothetical protein
MWLLALKKAYGHRAALVLYAFWATPVFRTILWALKIHNGLVGNLPVHSSQLAIGCLLAILAPRTPRIRRPIAFAMLAVFALVRGFLRRAACLSYYLVAQPTLRLPDNWTRGPPPPQRVLASAQDMTLAG